MNDKKNIQTTVKAIRGPFVSKMYLIIVVVLVCEFKLGLLPWLFGVVSPVIFDALTSG